MQDNQQKGMSFGSVIKRPSLASMVDRFQTFQANAKQKKSDESYADSMNSMENLRVASLNSQNHGVAKTCNRAVKLSRVAEGIKDYYKDQIDFTDSFWTPEKVVDEYLAANPNSEPYLKAYVTNDADTTCDPTELYKTMGRWKDDTKEEEKSGELFETKTPTGVNIGGGIASSIYGLPKAAAKAGAWLGEKSLKLLGADEQRAEEAGNTVKEGIDKMFAAITPGDQESNAFQNANEVTDIAQLLIPGTQEEKIAQYATKYPKWKSVVNFFSKKPDELPTLQKYLRLATKGVDDMTRYNAINEETTDPIEMGVAAGINMLLGGGGKLVDRVAGKIGLKGLMTSSKAKKVAETIDYEGGSDVLGGEIGSKGKVKALEEWFSKRPFKGTKDKIAKQLGQWASKFKAIKDELLGTVDDKFESPETSKIINQIVSKMKSSPAYREDVAAELEGLLREDNMYTFSEMEKVLRHLDDSDLNPYLKDAFGQYKKDELSRTIKGWRQTVQKTIEDNAEEMGLGDIRAMNREIITALKAREGILNKSWTEELSKAAGWGVPAAVISYANNGDWGGMIKAFGMGSLASMLGGTWFRTYLSKGLTYLSGQEKVALTQWLDSKGKEALSEVGSKAINKIIKKGDKSITTKLKDTILDGVRKYIETNGTEKIDDMIED